MKKNSKEKNICEVMTERKPAILLIEAFFKYLVNRVTNGLNLGVFFALYIGVIGFLVYIINKTSVTALLTAIVVITGWFISKELDRRHEGYKIYLSKKNRAL